MGNFLSLHCDLQYQLNGLSGNAFKIYLLFLRCVSFQPKSRRPAHGSDFFVYSYSKAKKNGYVHNKMQFWRGVRELIDNDFVKIIEKGNFQGKTGQKKQNLFQLKLF